jgi:hypothetical protein
MAWLSHQTVSCDMEGTNNLEKVSLELGADADHLANFFLGARLDQYHEANRG